MNSIILIAACAVCLDQLFFRGRLASYVVDNLKGPKKKHTGHDAAPHTPKAGSLARQTPEILVSKSYRCGLERTGADWSGHRHRPGRRRCYICPGFGREVRDGVVERACRAAPDRRRRRTLGARSARRRPIPASGSPRQSRTPRCGSSCDARRAGLRRMRRYGRCHGRGAAGHCQLRHPGLCLTRKRETT